jgi:DNA primase
MNINLEDAILEFDIISFLENQGIDYTLDSKNVGSDWIGVQPCPSCGDTSYHFGISKENKTFNCWVCSATGSLTWFMKIMCEIPLHMAREIIIGDRSSDDSEIDVVQKVKNIFKRSEKSSYEVHEDIRRIKLPKNVRVVKRIIQENEALANLFEEKKLNHVDAKMYRLKLGTEGYAANKLILPIYHNGRLRAYQQRDLTKKQYHNEGDIKQLLFDLEDIPKNSNIIVVEGFFDYTNVRNFVYKYYPKRYYCTTPFSKLLTDEQITLLNNLYPSLVVFFFDRDAWFHYHKYNQRIICPTKFLIPTRDKDPNKMTGHELLKLFSNHGL